MFLNVNAALEAMFDIRPLHREVGGLMALEELPDEATTEHFLGTDLWNRAQVRAWAEEVRALANQAPPDELIRDPVARAYALNAGVALTLEAKTYFDDDLGRPGAGFPLIIRGASRLEMILHLQGQKPWCTEELKREFLRQRLLNLPAELAEATDLWFGEDSVGWFGAFEKAATLEGMTGLIGPESREEFLELWLSVNGDPEEFARRWSVCVAALRLVASKLDCLPLNGEVRRGEAGYRNYLDLMGMSITSGALRDMAEHRWHLCNAEADRLADMIRPGATWQEIMLDDGINGTGMPTTGEELLSLYRQEAENVIATMRQAGLIRFPWPVANYDIEVRETPAEDRCHVPTAALQPCRGTLQTQRVSYFLVTGPDGHPDPATQLSRHIRTMRQVTAHEVGGHGVQFARAAHVVPPNWTGMSAYTPLEGMAFVLEFLICQKRIGGSTVLDMLACIVWAMRRYARMMAGFEIHALNLSRDEVTRNYTERCGISRLDAARDLVRAFNNVGLFEAYFLGGLAIEAAAEQFFGGDVSEVVAQHLLDTAGCVPMQFWLVATGRIKSPRDFKWETDGCWPVKVSQEMFPPK